MTNDKPPPRTVKPESLPMPPTEEEIAFHLRCLNDIEKNLENGVDPLTFPASWIRMWTEFDRRMMHELGHRHHG